MHADQSTGINHTLNEQISLYPKGDGAIIFVHATGDYLQVNEIGRIVLEGLLQGQSVRACVDLITPQYQAERQTIERDVEQFLTDMRKHIDL